MKERKQDDEEVVRIDLRRYKTKRKKENNGTSKIIRKKSTRVIIKEN